MIRDEVLMAIVDRCINDKEYLGAVVADPESALEEYELTSEESAAVIEFRGQLRATDDEEVITALARLRRQGAL